uniref:precorrin-2 dehydrogenase n=1 Tax=Candidatus Methanomethylicus mesodigestus TaxID=1867258 RepID=A0A7C3J3Y0_9CREN
MLFYIVTEDLRALVVGSGNVGRRKIFKLIEGGADVTVVTREEPKLFIGKKLKVVIGDGLEYAAENIDDFDLIVAATNDATINSKISALARKKGKLANSVTSPDDCNLIFPAVIDYGKFMLGITTGGRDPTLSKKVKKILHKALRKEDF